MKHRMVHLPHPVEDASIWVLTVVMLILSLGTFVLLWLKANQI